MPGGRGCDDWDRRSADGDADQLHDVDLENILIEENSNQLLATQSQPSPHIQQSLPSQQSQPSQKLPPSQQLPQSQLSPQTQRLDIRRRNTGRLPGNTGGRRRGGPDRRAMRAHNRALVELPEEKLTDDERARVREVVTLKLLQRMQANAELTPTETNRLTAMM